MPIASARLDEFSVPKTGVREFCFRSQLSPSERIRISRRLQTSTCNFHPYNFGVTSASDRRYPSSGFLFRSSHVTRHSSHSPFRSSLVTRHSSLPHAFTLLELLVVIGIISLLLVAVIPAVNSLSKSSGRKGAISNLLGTIEQARAQAIKDGRPTYIVFATTLSTTDQNLIQRHLFRSFAIFEDDPSNPSDHADLTDPADSSKPKLQVTSWKNLPTGVSVRANISASPWKRAPFAFTPEGASTTENFSYLMFNSSGEVQSPDPAPANSVTIAVFEGYVNGTTEVVTGKKDTSGNPLASESVAISRLTGRAERM